MGICSCNVDCTGNMGIVHNMKDKTIPLTQQQYSELERAMQWPEDMAAYNQLNTPTKLYPTIKEYS